MIVGAYRTDDEDEMVRIKEYSPSFDEARFAAHESFFVEDVRPWVGSRFGVVMPPNAPQCAAYRRVQSSHSPWGFGIRTSTERSSPLPQVPGTGRLL
jgi:hypothetical protein